MILKIKLTSETEKNESVRKKIMCIEKAQADKDALSARKELEMSGRLKKMEQENKLLKERSTDFKSPKASLPVSQSKKHIYGFYEKF